MAHATEKPLPDALEICIQPGNASVETIQEVLESISGLYTAAGGEGFRFEEADDGLVRIVTSPPRLS